MNIPRRWGILAVFTFSFFLFPLACSAAGAEEDKTKPSSEIHEIVAVDGNRVGTLHTTTHKHDKDGKLLRTTATLELSLRRYGALVRLRKEEGSVETADGKVLAVFMRQGQAGGKQMLLTGLVEGDKLHVKVDGGRIERRLNWSAEVIGLRQQETMFSRKKPKVGDRFSFRRFDSTYNTVVTVRVEVKEPETVDVLGTRKSLLRIELTPDKIEVPGHTVRPPRAVYWLEDFAPIRRQIELDGLGTLILTRTTQKMAGATATVRDTDIGKRSLIALNRGIPNPYDTRSVVYRVTVKDEEDPATVLSRDGHQEVRNVKGSSFELHVHPVRPGGGVAGTKAAAEYLASCHYIDHEDSRIRELARKAVGLERDDWKKAVRIERWVKGMMRNDNTAVLVPASQVARTMRGDCRHHALLTTALCRAEEIPSRTAIGLLYVYKGGPVLGFHMWTEVFIAGQWLGLDSTLGRGGVSAAHVKISDHSWHATLSLTPLLPVSRVLGKSTIAVIRIDR